jgi:hypothetical protein
MTIISWRTTLLAGALLGLACTTDVCGCPPTPAIAAVFGRVQTADGAPVSQARVWAYVAWDGNCIRRESPDGTALTRGDGTYTVWVAAGGEDEASCVRVQVRAPLESDLLDAPDTMVTLAIRYAAPFDSTRVDATLSAP